MLEGERQNIFSLDTAQLVTATPAERAAIPVRPREISTLDTGAFIDASVTNLLQGGQAKLAGIKAAIEQARGVTIPDAVFVRAAKQAASEGKISLPDGIKSSPM